MENNVLLRKVPLTLKDMFFRGFKNYDFEQWNKSGNLIPVEKTGKVVVSIIEECTWGYIDKYNPIEIRGYSYTWSIKGEAIVTTCLFPTHWQAMEEFKILIKNKMEEMNKGV